MSRVTPAEAARQLGVNRSTITRWVKKNPALADEDGLVSVGDLRAHRDNVINPALQTRGQATAADPDPAPAAAPQTVGPSLNDHRSRKAEADAIEAELDLAERLNLTLRRDQVEAALAEVANVLKQTASQLVRDRAEALSMIDDPREMERALDEVMRELLLQGSRALEAASQGDVPADAA